MKIIHSLTRSLQPSSQSPTGSDRSHRVLDVVPTSNWCKCVRDTRQVSDRGCFSFFEGRPDFEECVDPDMYIRFHVLCVKSPRFTIVHTTTENEHDDVHDGMVVDNGPPSLNTVPSFVVKKVWCGSVVSLIPPGLVLM